MDSTGAKGYPMTQSTTRKGDTPENPGAKRNSLRLDDRELNVVLDRLDAENGPGASKSSRTYVRWPFRHSSIGVSLVHPGGSASHVTMACRNLSCGGVGLLHSCYIHAGTRCTIGLPHPFRGVVQVSGVVTACRHRQGLLHELGVKFDEQINVRDFIRPDPFREYFSLERVKPEELRGTVLYVEDSLLDQKIIKHYLRETSLCMKGATTRDEAIEAARQNVDLILCDFHLPDCDGSEFVRLVREDGIAAPIIMVTSDNSSITRTKVRGSAADAFLAKPLTQDRILRAIAEFLLVDKPAGLLTTSLKSDDPMYGLIDGFVEQLREIGRELEATLTKDDSQTCFSLCQKVRGNAPVLGFESIGRLAERASEVVARTGSTKEARRPVQELIAACQRAIATGRD